VIRMFQFFAQDHASTDRPILFARPYWWVFLLAVAAVSCGGCDDNGNTAVISGQVMLDGRRVPAEIQIEQLDDRGVRTGRSTTVFANESGKFSTSIERQTNEDGPLTCRLVVRISQLSRSGLPAAFDESAPREKVVRLRRVVRNNDSLTLLLTQ